MQQQGNTAEEHKQTGSFWRQLDIFNPEDFNEEVHVIGVGATGSWIAYMLAKSGVRKIHAWDFDDIAPHNVPNSIYGNNDIGKLKVSALAEKLDRECDCVVVQHPEKVDGSQKLSGFVFLCTDTMSSRQEIWEKAIKLKPNVKLMIETRLGAEFGMIHTVRPLMKLDIEGFEGQLYSNDEAEESPCTYRAIATNVSVIAGMAAHKLIKYASGETLSPIVRLQEEHPTSEVGDEHSGIEMFCIRPIIATAAAWVQ